MSVVWTGWQRAVRLLIVLMEDFRVVLDELKANTSTKSGEIDLSIWNYCLPNITLWLLFVRARPWALVLWRSSFCQNAKLPITTLILCFLQEAVGDESQFWVPKGCWVTIPIQHHQYITLLNDVPLRSWRPLPTSWGRRDSWQLLPTPPNSILTMPYMCLNHTRSDIGFVAPQIGMWYVLPFGQLVFLHPQHCWRHHFQETNRSTTNFNPLPSGSGLRAWSSCQSLVVCFTINDNQTILGRSLQPTTLLLQRQHTITALTAHLTSLHSTISLWESI